MQGSQVYNSQSKLDHYRDFPLDVVLPRSQWLTILPEDNGLLCAACIVKRAAKVPRCTVVHAILEISSGTASPEGDT